MQLIFLTLSSLAVVLASSDPITIIRYEREDLPNNGWHFYYEQSDGQKREETGRFKNPGTDDEILEQTGWYSYIGDDGRNYRVDYIADENGFVPTGDHLNPAKAAEQMVRIPEDMEIESLPGAPQSGPAITIIKFVREDRPNNGWYFFYEQSDGQKREETGRFKNPGTDDEILEQKGWYSYIGDDGKTYRVDYIADENGFVPTGDHLPVPVETPVVKVKESVAPVEKPKIIRYNREDLPNNGWHFFYELSDGQKREETGIIKNPESMNPILEQKGWYSFIGTDGKTYRVDY